MAMFERDGYCPSNSFGFMLRAMDAQEMAVKLRDKFGDRLGYMVYAKNEMFVLLGDEEYSSIVEACKNPCLAYDLASLLAFLIPECIYAEKGRRILIHDAINPVQAALEPVFETSSGLYSFQNGTVNKHPLTKKGSKYLIQDLKWLLVIDDGDGNGPVDVRITRLTI